MRSIRSRAAPGSRLLLLAALLLALPLHADFSFSPALPVAKPRKQQLVDLERVGERLVAVGELGLIIYSDDGGNNWQQAAVPVSVTLTAVTFTADGTGFAVGHGGVILRSKSRGERWENVFDGYAANEQFLAYAKQDQARVERALEEQDALENPDPEILEALEFDLENAVFALDDAKEAMETGPADPFLDVLFLDDRNGLAVGAYGMVYRTRDGGDSWQLDIAGLDNPFRNHLYCLVRDRGGRLHLSGEAGLLFYSDDDGASWTRTEDVYDGSLFALVAGEQTLFTLGLRGNLFRSSDRGETWSPVTLEGEGSLYGGVASGDQIILVGSGGRLVYSDDGGRSFRETNHPSRAALSDVAISGDQLLLAGMTGLQLEPRKELGGG
jgi:photosystem II stability/assembly factor-like uncharacterized protein